MTSPPKVFIGPSYYYYIITETHDSQRDTGSQPASQHIHQHGQKEMMTIYLLHIQNSARLHGDHFHNLQHHIFTIYIPKI